MYLILRNLVIFTSLASVFVLSTVSVSGATDSANLSLAVIGIVPNPGVVINTNKKVCPFNFLAKPEKRIPREGNWGTALKVDFLDSRKNVTNSIQARSDKSGKASVNLCDQGIAIESGNYNFYVRGLSHLRKYYGNVNVVKDGSSVVDFSSGGSRLLAGETSNTFDNKINSLDASTQIRAFYKTDDEKNDLNRDEKVNSLDFSNTVFNFYKLGE